MLSVVFLALGYVTFFSLLTSRLVSFTDSFHYVTYGIFALWFSLNQKFVIKFSVSFDTDQVERTRPSHVINTGLRSTKNLKGETRHLSPPTDNMRGLKSLLL